MILQAPDLTLRPIPGPEPVPLPDYSNWLWIVPVVLISFLWFWWSRKRVHPPADPQDQLYLAMTNAAEKEYPVLERFTELNQALRKYLAWRYDPAWLTVTGNESEPLWNKLLTGDTSLSKEWYQRWLEGEEHQFGRTSLSEDQLSAYVQAVEELESYLIQNMKVE